MLYKGRDKIGQTIYGNLIEEENGNFYLKRDVKEVNVNVLTYELSETVLVEKDSLRKQLSDGIFEGDIYLDSDENKLIKISSIDEIEPYMIKISDDYNKLMLNELDLAEWIEPQSDFKYDDMVYEYCENGEFEKEKVIYSGVVIIITEFEIEGKVYRNIYPIEKFKETFEAENKWSRWLEYRRIDYNYNIPTLVNVQYRIRNNKEIQMKGKCKLNDKILKVHCKLAEGDEFSVYVGTKVCALKLHKKVLNLMIKNN